MLLALTAAPSYSELKYLIAGFMAKLNKLQLYFSIFPINKILTKMYHLPPLVFHKFEHDQFSCIVSLLDTYFQPSQPWRNGASKKQHPLSCRLGERDFEKFRDWQKSIQGYSARSADISNANLMVISVVDILKRKNWSNKPTW